MMNMIKVNMYLTVIMIKMILTKTWKSDKN